VSCCGRSYSWIPQIGGVVFAYVAEVVAMGGGCFGYAVARTEALASIPTGEVSQRCTKAP
jgi:hypothetical protein